MENNHQNYIANGGSSDKKLKHNGNALLSSSVFLSQIFPGINIETTLLSVRETVLDSCVRMRMDCLDEEAWS